MNICNCVITCFQVIGDCHASGMNGEIAAKYGLINDSQDRNVFIEFCLHTILYQQSSQRSETWFSSGAIYKCQSISLQTFFCNIKLKVVHASS